MGIVDSFESSVAKRKRQLAEASETQPVAPKKASVQGQATMSAADKRIKAARDKRKQQRAARDAAFQRSLRTGNN